VPVNEPGIQLYVEPFAAVKTDEDPLQIVAGAAVTVILGKGFTVIVFVVDDVHPFAFVAVIVYVVVAVGETVTEEPVNEPGIHEYVFVVTLAVMVALPPAQIVVVVHPIVKLGKVFTVIVLVEVAEHPAVVVPVTVYVVVAVGETFTVAPVNEPGIQA
jgi:hypothetical protein